MKYARCVKQEGRFVVEYEVFFFQAEDGIRDTSVTGVQTCALPIYYTLLKLEDKGLWRGES